MQHSNFQFIKRKELTLSEKERILELWNNEYPEKLAHNSLQELKTYLENLSEQSHILVVDEKKEIIGWYFSFIRNSEKWFAIILNSKVQGLGIGTKILNRVKQEASELNGWVIDHNRDKKKNGIFYTSPLNFYLKNGFKKIPECRLELDKISAVKIQWQKT